jgi:hypothetical protein
MTEQPDITESPDKIGIKALFGQLVDDTGAFARAELSVLKAQAGERAAYAIPGFVMLSVGVALAFGAIVALLIGIGVWLSFITGPVSALLIVTFGALSASALLFKLGADRLSNVFKPRADK